jgi:xylan 1,4-beta-xylosidase
VWNEPNIDFWAGNPKEETYYRLYDETAKTLKSVDPRLRVGGPATAQAAWVDRFIRHTVDAGAPLDFVSTHVYGNDSARDVFGTDEQIPRSQMVCRAVRKVHDQIQASARPQLPLIWTEYNASYMNETAVTDSIYMGPWMADTIQRCDGLTDMMSYWTFSDVFEEQGVVKRPFYGGYGLVAEDGLPKPAFNAFELLHHLGAVRIPERADDILVTRRTDGSIVIALWNLSAPETSGEPKDVNLHFDSLAGNQRAAVYRLDANHGSLTDAYAAMGSPAYPTPAQIQSLKAAAQLAAPEAATILDGNLALHLERKALVIIEIP